MALKFLPVQTPFTVGILILTRDKYLQSEFELALHEYKHVFYAQDTHAASQILTNGQVGVAVVDAALLESDDNEFISETLACFPEMLLVPFVEIGSAHNLNTLSEKYSVYRYLRIPSTHKQIARCIRSATKKYLNEDSIVLPFLVRKKYIATLTLAIIVISLSLILLVSGPSHEEDSQNQTTAELQQNDFNKNIEILTPETTDVPPRIKVISVLEQTLLNAHKAYKAEHFYVPEDKSAFSHYIQALEIEPENHEALTGLKLVLTLLVDEINSSLQSGEYQHAIELAELLLKKLPNSSLAEPLHKHLAQQGMELITQAKQFAQEGKLDSANTSLANAAILLGQNHEAISSAKTYISSAREDSESLDSLLEKAQLRLNDNDLTKPKDDSAKFYLLSLKDKAPENNKVTSLILELADKLLGYANSAIDENNIPRAKYFLEEAMLLGVRKEAINTLKEKITLTEKDRPISETMVVSKPPNDTIQARIEKQERMNELLILARKSYNTAQYYEPEGNNTKYFLLLAKKIDPENGEIKDALNELADKLLSMIKIKLAEKQMTNTDKLLEHVKQLGVRTDEINKLEASIN